jgi:alpha-L-rhamnosidase
MNLLLLPDVWFRTHKPLIHWLLHLIFFLEDLVPKAAAFLAEDVKKWDTSPPVLWELPCSAKHCRLTGYEDLAFMFLNRQNIPSWLYPVTQGATTIWERWDGQKPDGSFQDVGMNSFNHYAYGAIGEWLYRLCGRN